MNARHFIYLYNYMMNNIFLYIDYHRNRYHYSAESNFYFSIPYYYALSVHIFYLSMETYVYNYRIEISVIFFFLEKIDCNLGDLYVIQVLKPFRRLGCLLYFCIFAFSVIRMCRQILLSCRRNVIHKRACNVIQFAPKCF